MTLKPRTIDDLGVSASIRYAKDKELFEPGLLEESRLIPQRTEVPVLKPYVLSDFDQRFSLSKTSIWATFSPPPNYYSTSTLLFSYQLIPSLGGDEKQEADMDKLESLGSATDSDQEGQSSDGDPNFADEKEREILLSFFKVLRKLDKVLAIINSRRNQYQRG